MEEYSKFGRTSEIYAARLTSSLFIRRFLHRNPRVLFPFFTVLSIWSFHVMSCEILLRYRMAGITESAMVAYTHKYAVV